MDSKKSLILAAALLVGTSAASAEGLGVSVNAGLVGLGLGAGADITYSVNPSVNVRGGFMQGSKSANVTLNSNDYAATMKTSTMGLFADWMIFQGDLRLTAGYVTNGGSIGLSAAAGSTIDFGLGVPITLTSPLSADVKFKASPYVGIGWGNAAQKNDTIGFNMDIGLLIDASPSVAITAADATAAQITTLESNIAGNSSVKALPVITVGLTYHF
ncbi:MAG: hypothetical protein OEL79_02725 [Chromatiales bacterium]|nr:hypothetical protein [Chromatiales bacterium]